ncbi:hypothetical protein M407DRAFT_18642 [Tulasnella calospora MUT 4182]|uniref:F-box domain-containing protein n=1 Tax=Tulasnella calospora MUT 4182 TaxID=1051891 RepID=A0A0C3MF42_9AGAM|nr:hypothetical protein M407DRAFT_18642 [Tulasnella calospora MUT 4182]
MSQLPIELLTLTILLSLNTLSHARKITRTEELRLVNRAWKTTIDSTPLFWTCITDKPSSSPEMIKSWIRKSGGAPLHILFEKDPRSIEAFMSLVTPHIHRWRELEIQGWGSNISTYINEPAPMLESLVLYSVPLSSNEIPFSGTTPSLSSVTLGNVSFSQDPTILRNLKNLSLRNITYDQRSPPLSWLRGTLSACPDLEQLELDGRYIAEPPWAHQPVLLAKLSSFCLRGLQNPPDTTEAIFGMITAPHLPLIRLAFDEHWAWRTMNILSPLSTKRLLRYTGFCISIHNWLIQIVTITDGGEVPSPPPTVVVNLSSYARMGGPALKILEDVGKAAPLSATVDIVVTDPRSTRLISNYLRSTVEEKDASFGHPLPQLRTFQMNVGFQENRPCEAEDLLSELAQTRQDIPRIRIKMRKGSGVDGFDIFQWDRASSSFVSPQ